MKPEYITHAQDHQLKVPVLTHFMRHRSYAEGVFGVVPTVTYPSHATLVTGVWPAEHGVIDNTIFDPLREHANTWYWDFADIKVPTLYTAADTAGIKTANVGWPVTINAPIDYNIADGLCRLRTRSQTQFDFTDGAPLSRRPTCPRRVLESKELHRPTSRADHQTGLLA